MKARTALNLILSLSLFASGAAHADWGHHGGPGRFGPPAPPMPMHHHHHGNDWVVPAAVLAITGLAVGAALSEPRPQPQPVYVAPPPPPIRVQPAPGVWYYCNSSGQYYPYVDYCPEGWQPVSPR